MSLEDRPVSPSPRGASAEAGAVPPKAPRPASTPRKKPPRAVRAPLRRQKHRIRRVDLWSVLKMSLCFFTAMVLMWLVSALVVWKIADSFGAVTRIESFVDNLFETKLVISPGIILKQGVVIAIVIDALCVIGSVIAAAFYNLFSELFGGIEIYTYEQDIDPRV
ncbi:MAG: DUF3566 domain-containing protein [Acidimicrobiia bacterium]